MYDTSPKNVVILLLELILYILLDAMKFKHAQDVWNRNILLIVDF